MKASLRVLGLGVLLCSLNSKVAIANNYESIDQIKSTAEAFALSQILEYQLINPQAHANIMDSRLMLSKCELPLEGFSSVANSTNFNIARTTIGVRCNGVKPWTLYVPVSISGSKMVVYSNQPLLRGDILTNELLATKETSLKQLPLNYFGNSEEVIGMEVTRSVNSDTILSFNSVRARQLVQRGQEVVILAESANIQVRMNGIALKNGGSGELITVKNIDSGRTVEARVVNETTVVVNM